MFSPNAPMYLGGAGVGGWVLPAGGVLELLAANNPVGLRDRRSIQQRDREEWCEAAPFARV